MHTWELRLEEEKITFYDVTTKLGNVILRHYLIDDFKKKGNFLPSNFELTCGGKRKATEYYAIVLIRTMNEEQLFGAIFEWLSLGLRIVAVAPKELADQPTDVILSRIEDFASKGGNVKEMEIIVSQKTKFSGK
ncbi:MAG: hypothetical protein B6U95_08545 [Thermofilum sp. ex4484_82]|nr:MAG: hypothetical protein B6U95_08545 [Thermofilum sp. ex4484_82]OYT36376.1 MAG: hypothetical protein B6U96_08545 [Archaeoglobales archaeon ex4484_92]